MSAFMVSDRTINHILVGIESSYNHANGYPYLYGLLKNAAAEPEILGESLVAMNARAIEARYGEDENREFNYDPINPPSRAQILKSLHCYLYQCSEGEVPQEELYKALDKYAGDLAYEIVSELPEYEAAKWD